MYSLKVLTRYELNKWVKAPDGYFVPKYLSGKKYFFDGSIWGWK